MRLIKCTYLSVFFVFFGNVIEKTQWGLSKTALSVIVLGSQLVALHIISPLSIHKGEDGGILHSNYVAIQSIVIKNYVWKNNWCFLAGATMCKSSFSVSLIFFWPFGVLHFICTDFHPLVFAALRLRRTNTVKCKKKKKRMKKSQISASLMWKPSTANSNKFQDKVQSKWIRLERTFPRATCQLEVRKEMKRAPWMDMCLCIFIYLSAYTVLPACLLFSSAELLMVEIRLMIKIII